MTPLAMIEKRLTLPMTTTDLIYTAGLLRGSAQSLYSTEAFDRWADAASLVMALLVDEIQRLSDLCKEPL